MRNMRTRATDMTACCLALAEHDRLYMEASRCRDMEQAIKLIELVRLAAEETLRLFRLEVHARSADEKELIAGLRLDPPFQSGAKSMVRMSCDLWRYATRIGWSRESVRQSFGVCSLS